MQQYYQLGDFQPVERQFFPPSTKSDYKDISIYFHKRGFYNVVVRGIEVHKKIHCWHILKLQIIQYANQYGTRQKAIMKIKLDSQIIFSLLDKVNTVIGRQIIKCVENISSELRLWCSAPIDNIFKVNEKTHMSLDFKQGYLEIAPILYYTDRYYYYEYHCWIASIEDNLIEIEKAKHLSEASSSLSLLFEEICNSIEEEQKQEQQKQGQYKQEEKEKQESHQEHNQLNEQQGDLQEENREKQWIMKQQLG